MTLSAYALLVMLCAYSPRARDDSAETVKEERFFPLQNGSLQISGAEKGDSGEYVCTAFNTEGESSVTAVLEVKGISAEMIQNHTLLFEQVIAQNHSLQGQFTQIIECVRRKQLFSTKVN